MKNLLIIASLSLLANVAVWAQSSANSQRIAEKKGKSSAKQGNESNNSQLKGMGVPKNKEKEQFGKSISTRKNGPIPPSSVSSGPGVSDAKKGAATPGSHVAQREMKIGHKTRVKTGGTSSKTNNR